MIRHSCSLPKSFAWILSRLAIYEDMFSITRDFEIEYAGICQDHGRAAATLWLAWNTLKIVLSYLAFTMKWRSVMFKNNLKIAFRILRRQKGYSFIYISGLISFSTDLSLAIAILAVIHKSLQAATADPVDSLRYE